MFSEGVSSQEAARVASSVAEAGTAREGILCVEVASSRRSMDDLFALHPTGTSFFPRGEEAPVVVREARGGRARHGALALRESSRRHEHVSALLSLSQAMARADSITEVAREVTDAVIELIGRDRSSMWVWDDGTASLRREWTAGAAPAGRRESLGIDDTPYLAAGCCTPHRCSSTSRTGSISSR